ncbi:hypothetical protein HJG60_009879 [Phyllostomus discolor]|uniref:Uncharacterized protein n=1 Tax=Phyllostomus discolor TaxID=89673 RepID=A0A834EQJ9_9CHIR|nr:hypothetical protein HJG60_009879 [Phyllostomus discolor]
MCPDWGSKWQPFDLQVGTQSTEPHQTGRDFCIIAYDLIYFPRSDEIGLIWGGMTIDSLICLVALGLNSSVGMGRINLEPRIYSGIQHLCPECLLCASHCVSAGMRGFSPLWFPPNSAYSQ